MNRKVVMIMLTCNQEELLKKNLRSLAKTEWDNGYKVYVIDDSGKNYISKQTKEEFPWVTFYVNKKNEGVPYSFNWGMKQGFEVDGANYCVLLNDDLEFIDKYWLHKLVTVIESDEKIGLVAPKMMNPDGSMQYFYKNNKIQFAQFKNNIEETEETFKIVELNELVGTCCLFSKRVYNEIGGWDMTFSPIYGEDTDWSIRARKKGFKQMYVGNTKVIHYGGASSEILFKLGNEGKWYLQKSHGIRNEWLNFSINRIIRLTIIHFASALFSKHPFKKLKLLFKAYDENFELLSEIRAKRHERNNWEKI